MAKLRQRQSAKTKLNTTLKGMLPYLEAPVTDIDALLSEHAKENPYIDIKSRIRSNFTDYSNNINRKTAHIATGNSIENIGIREQSLFDVLNEQISFHYFPTPRSQKIAFAIIENIDNEGYLDADIPTLCEELEIEIEEFHNIRKRFAYLNPSGIGALNMQESLLFQLESSTTNDEIYDLCKKIILKLDSHFKFRNHPFYAESMKLIKSFNNPPAIEYLATSNAIIPDLIVEKNDDGALSMRLNDEFYPIVKINQITLKSSNDPEAKAYIKAKMKEAKDVIDALNMRSATIRKIGNMIFGYQYDFFLGGELIPMKLKDIADEFKHSPSTISRAIANKYLECDRGIFPIKSFFSTAIGGEEVSNATIKDFISELIKSEDKKRPLSDAKILSLVEEKFNLKIVRRTIAKYRSMLDIASSSNRKKIYDLEII